MLKLGELVGLVRTFKVPTEKVGNPSSQASLLSNQWRITRRPAENAKRKALQKFATRSA